VVAIDNESIHSVSFLTPCCEDGSMHPRVREARETDLDRIRQLIIDLASYERAAQEVKTTTEQLRIALFGPQPAAYALVAESGEEVVGFALYFRSFSTWEGVHGLYLEDLYVMPEYRGSGLGKALLTCLAGLAVELGYARLEWAVLDWNQPAIDFYRRLGAVAMDEWTVYRLSGEALNAAATAD
jgi:GNAT superfamily N-acetyltransferase